MAREARRGEKIDFGSRFKIQFMMGKALLKQELELARHVSSARRREG